MHGTFRRITESRDGDRSAACEHASNTHLEETDMGTQATTFGGRKGPARSLIGATVLTAAVLGGAALWQVRFSGPGATPATSAAVGHSAAGTAPMGGLAELYLEQSHELAAARAARVPVMGGMAELYAEQAAETRAAIERNSRMGGMAELYQEQAAARGQ